jgi:RNA-dependent RNA polymerase
MLGDVLVTRNPCTHPGDLRVLTAVDRPELRHLVNVIVFSTLGERPNCQMMAGGDLDGDVYFVSWDRDLLKYLTPENMMEPASYVKPTVLKEKPDSETLADYFVFYLERDVLGKLANMHLALCDLKGRDGPKDEGCLHLAHL